MYICDINKELIIIILYRKGFKQADEFDKDTLDIKRKVFFER